jgi:RNA-directed DNA polymerase
LLGVPLQRLTWWIYALRADRRYQRFEVARRRGGPPRIISAPIKPIKDLQRTLAEVLTASYDPPPYAHGFVQSRSPVSNARWHQNKNWLLKVDIEDFFPTINFGRVRGMFMAYPFDYPAEVATLLAQLCCHRNQLPQGAPTSPIVSNFICRGLDSQLGRLARDQHCHYTRYADDISISTDRRSFPGTLASFSTSGFVELGRSLETIIRANGFSPNVSKTRLVHRAQRQRVTGLVVNEKTNVPSDYVRDLRNILHIWKRYGEDDAAAAFARWHGVQNRPPFKGPPPSSGQCVARSSTSGTSRAGATQPIAASLGLSRRVTRPSDHRLF